MDMRLPAMQTTLGCPASFSFVPSDGWIHIMGGNRNEKGESRHHWLRRYCNW